MIIVLMGTISECGAMHGSTGTGGGWGCRRDSRGARGYSMEFFPQRARMWTFLPSPAFKEAAVTYNLYCTCATTAICPPRCETEPRREARIHVFLLQGVPVLVVYYENSKQMFSSAEMYCTYMYMYVCIIVLYAMYYGMRLRRDLARAGNVCMYVP